MISIPFLLCRFFPFAIVVVVSNIRCGDDWNLHFKQQAHVLIQGGYTTLPSDMTVGSQISGGLAIKFRLNGVRLKHQFWVWYLSVCFVFRPKVPMWPLEKRACWMLSELAVSSGWFWRRWIRWSLVHGSLEKRWKEWFECLETRTFCYRRFLGHGASRLTFLLVLFGFLHSESRGWWDSLTPWRVASQLVFWC